MPDSAQLAPMITALSEVEDECARLRDTATAAARQRLRRAERQAAELVRAAQEDAPAEGVRVAARLRAQGQAELARITAQAEAAAAAVRAQAALRLPALVEAALAHARVQLSALAAVGSLADPGRAGTGKRGG